MIVYQCVGEPPEVPDSEWIYDSMVFLSQEKAEVRLKKLIEENENTVDENGDDFYSFYLVELKLIKD